MNCVRNDDRHFFRVLFCHPTFDTFEKPFELNGKKVRGILKLLNFIGGRKYAKNRDLCFDQSIQKGKRNLYAGSVPNCK